MLYVYKNDMLIGLNLIQQRVSKFSYESKRYIEMNMTHPLRLKCQCILFTFLNFKLKSKQLQCVPLGWGWCTAPLNKLFLNFYISISFICLVSKLHNLCNALQAFSQSFHSSRPFVVP